MKKVLCCCAPLILGVAALFAPAPLAAAEPVSVVATAKAQTYGPYRYRYQAERVAYHLRSRGYYTSVYYRYGYWWVRAY